MAADEPLLAALDFAMHEAALFSACGFLLLGTSDLLVDLIWIVHKLRRLWSASPQLCADSLPAPQRPGRLAVFIPAWDEAAVIDRMLGALTGYQWAAGVGQRRRRRCHRCRRRG